MVIKQLFGPTILGVVLMASLGHGATTPRVDRGAEVSAFAKTPQQASNASGDQAKDAISQGHAIFVQRCALCHLSPDGWRKSGLEPSIGPSLNGILKDDSPEREAVVRERIRIGSQAMPGFQYGLNPQQLDRLIAYLKTLR